MLHPQRLGDVISKEDLQSHGIRVLTIPQNSLVVDASLLKSVAELIGDSLAWLMSDRGWVVSKGGIMRHSNQFGYAVLNIITDIADTKAAKAKTKNIEQAFAKYECLAFIRNGGADDLCVRIRYGWHVPSKPARSVWLGSMCARDGNNLHVCGSLADPDAFTKVARSIAFLCDRRWDQTPLPVYF